MSSYGHSRGGINMANYRIVSEKQHAALSQPPYRTPMEWAAETGRHVDLGATQNKCSSSVRHSSNLVQAATAEQVVADLTSVEQSLRVKIAQTEQLKGALQATLTDTSAEIDQCVLLKASLEQRLGRVQDKVQLNESRLQARCARPSRERTMDGVEGMLLKQQGLVHTFEEKVKRFAATVERQVQQLEQWRIKLHLDLRDKAEAIDVDNRTLALQTASSSGAGLLLPPVAPGSGSAQGQASAMTASPSNRTGAAALRTPHAWAARTEENIRESRKTIVESIRLRKAIRHNVHDTRMAEHHASRSLNQNMVGKMQLTAGMKGQLERQLAKMRDEQAKVLAQRCSLVEAIAAKRGPLKQAHERLQARQAHPERERVADEAQAALQAELAHLNAISSQLTSKLGAVDRTLESLDLSMLTLEDNIRDKEAVLSLEERIALMDGRLSVSHAPPTSIASGMTSSTQMNEMHEVALRRINDLEMELVTARREREQMESNILQMKATLTPPPSHGSQH